jgi:hypothetical protein
VTSEARTAERLLMISESVDDGRCATHWLSFDPPVFVNPGERFWRDGRDLIVERRDGACDVHRGQDYRFRARRSTDARRVDHTWRP